MVRDVYFYFWGCVRIFWGCFLTFWEILRCFVMFWDALGCFGMFWEVLGHNTTFWVVLGRFGMFWDSYYSFDRTFRISKNLRGPRQPSSINICQSSIMHHPSPFCIQKYSKVSKSIQKYLRVLKSS